MKSPPNPNARGFRAHSWSSLKRLGSLCFVRMIRSNVDLELLAHLFAELILRQHAANRRLEHSLRMALHHLLGGNFLQPAGPTGVMPIDLVLQFVPGENHFLSVDDDNVIAHVQEGCISCLVLSHQQARGDRCEPADRLPVGIDDKPVAGLLEVLPARNECLHDTNLQISRKEKERTGYENAVGVVKAIRNGALAWGPIFEGLRMRVLTGEVAGYGFCSNAVR